MCPMSNLSSYWVADLDDGSVVSEENLLWTDISDRVVGLRLFSHGRYHSLPSGMSKYIQAKTMSAIVGSNEVKMESHYIGFQHENYEYCLRVNAADGDVSVEIREVKK